MLAVQIASGILIMAAIITAWRLRLVIKGKLSREEKDKKEKLFGLLLTIISIALAALQFFVAPTIENNMINQVNTTLNQQIEQVSTKVTNIQDIMDIITNNGAIFNGPVEQVNVYGPQGGGNNQAISEEPSPTSQNEDLDIETVEYWPVGWNDSSGGRRTYTIEEINNGALTDAVVFNSISDSTIGNELYFVGARENTGINAGKRNLWNVNSIEVEPGKTYFVRIYAHNNSAISTNVAHDVNLMFDISDPKHVTGNDLDLVGFDSSNGYYAVAVHGTIWSSNADPSWYVDGVKFVSDKPFHLVYVPGTAKFENNGIGNAKLQGYRLPDSIVGEWTLIGYEEIDGNIPACYKYASYTSIMVMPVFD